MNDTQIAKPPLGAEEVNPAKELRDFDSLLGSNPAQALLDYMEQVGATLDERNDVKRSFDAVGCKLTQVEMPLVQLLFARMILNQLRDVALKEGLKQNEQILDVARKGNNFVIANFKNRIEEDLKPLLKQSLGLHGEIADNLTQIQALLKELTSSGLVVDQFSTALLNRMVDGVGQQVLTIKSSLDESLTRQSSNIDAVDQRLTASINALSTSLQKASQVDTGLIAKALADKTAEVMKMHFEQSRIQFESQFISMGSQASIEMSNVLYDMKDVAREAKETIERKMWESLVKVGLGYLVISIVSMGVFFKWIWPWFGKL